MNFAAIIILFHPEQRVLLNNLAQLQQAGWQIIVVDNSPESHQHWLLHSVHYRHLPSNAGIAAAQNCGLDIAKQCGCDYAMLLDQDSQLSVSFLHKVSERAVYANQAYPNLAAYGPTIVSEFDNKAVKARLQKPQTLDDGFLLCRQIIASGKVIPLNVLDTTGMMDDTLFIDGVDHEWCWRAAQKGFRIIGDTHTQLLHRQGEDRKRLLGLEFKVGSPIRLYYQYRNILLLLRRPYVPRYWKIRNCIALPVRWLVNGWLLDQRKLRRKYMKQGLLDGFKGQAGPYKADQ